LLGDLCSVDVLVAGKKIQKGERKMTSKWKIDRLEWLNRFLKIIFWYVAMPIVVYAILTEHLNYPVDAYTYFAVFVFFFVKQTVHTLINPPKYQDVET
jgi:hypothetical protein